MRLIDSDALKEKANETDYMPTGKWLRLSDLDAAPTIEPKRGKWKPFDLTYGRSVWACDACGETVNVPTLNGKPIFDYCPWCGSFMGEEDETY